MFFIIVSMVEVIKATLSGLLVGFLFAALKLPIPAPPALAGIMGIVGIFLGFLIFNTFFHK